jgi:hypothetical protein
MSTAFYTTENVKFEFSRSDIEKHIKLLTKKHSIKKPSKLFVLLDLIATGKGSVTCTVCGKTYKADQLKPILIGSGVSPFHAHPETKGGVKGLFTKKKKIPLFGGQGFKCPEGHELISMVTWRT